MGRPVSPTSTTYPDADFGWMDAGVAKGYQAALTALAGGPSGRLLVSSQRYPGRTQSAACLHAAIREAEAVLGCHPQRRPDLVQTRLQALATALAQAQAQLQALNNQQQRLIDDLATTAAALIQAQTAVDQLEADPALQAHAASPHSRLSRARTRLATQERRQQRLHQRQVALTTRQQRRAERVTTLQQQQATLQQWHDRLGAEHARLTAPLPMVARVDAGFSTDANLTWLIEMGYAVVTNVHNGQITTRLRRGIADDARWERVGRNAEAHNLGMQHMTNCPYPLETLVVRYHLPECIRYTTLVSYGRADRMSPQWFQEYNARQVIEAGIKEHQGVLTMRRPLVRSPIGMQIQEQFSLFAANFLRWAAHWLRPLVQDANHALQDALGEVKTLVRVLTQCRAEVSTTASGMALRFDDGGPVAGATVILSGQVAIQEVLPLFNQSDWAHE